MIEQLVESRINKKHGIPKRIYYDSGLEFNNQKLRLLLEKYKIEARTSSPGHHNANGSVEGANQSLFNKIRKLNNYNIDN